MLSYSLYLAEIDEGRHPNPPAPPVALRYWNLPEGATLRDVILIIRADEAHHNDHHFYPIVGGGAFAALWIFEAPDRCCQAGAR